MPFRPPLLLAIALIITCPALAQVTLTTNYFPVAGDTLRTNLAAETDNLDLLTPGADRNWQFGTPTAERESTQAVVAVSNDTLFPNADLAILVNDSAATYYRTTATTFEIVGLTATLDLLPGFILSAPLSPPRPARRAGVTLGNSFTSEASRSITVSPDSLPTDLLSEALLEVIASVDSVRLTVTSNRTDTYDASGTAELGGNVYTVLRERRSEILTTRLAVKAGILPFIDVTGTVAAADSAFGSLLGEQDPQVSYLFWNDASKEPIAEATVDEEDNVTSFRYKRADATSSTPDFYLRQASVTVYPNPSTTEATFEIDGLGRGTYFLNVFDANGRHVAARTFLPRGNPTQLRLDVSTFRSGLYAYTLRNERGLVLTTKRLIVR